MNAKDINSNSVSLAGEFAVLSQLALRGFDASLTLGHTKGVDILVSSPKSGKMYRLEVKTNYRSKPGHSKLLGHAIHWIMGEKHEGVVDENLFFCFVNIENDSNSFRFFIVPNGIVSKYVEEQHKFWLSRDGGTHARVETTMRNFRIGVEDSQDEYQIFTPLAKDFEDKWELLQ
jgi:hypothetical protein